MSTTSNRRLKQSELKHWRDKLLAEQDRVCFLCGNDIESDPVLDHCHDTGRLRGVLHRQCNHAEGRIKDWIKRTGKSTNPIDFLVNLAWYISKDYSKNPLHPTHKTEQEKEILRLKRLRSKVKKPETKQKYTDRIKELECTK